MNLLPTEIQSEVFRYGCEIDPERMDPYMPMPDPQTGHLTVDPEILLKSRGFDLAIDFFYSSATDEIGRLGVSRSATFRTWATLGRFTQWPPPTTSPPGVTPSTAIRRGDFSTYEWSRFWNPAAHFRSGLRSKVEVITEPDINTYKVKETFPDGMEMRYLYPFNPVSGGEGGQNADFYYACPLESVTHPSGWRHTYIYENGGGGPGVNPGDATGFGLKTVGDHGQKLIRIETPGSRNVTFHYIPGADNPVTASLDKFSLISAIEDWTGRRTTFQYDPANYMTTVIYPSGCIAKYGYAQFNLQSGGTATLLQWIEDPRGYRTTYNYDNQRRVTSMTAGSAVWTWTYGGSTNTMQTPSGAMTTYVYDPLGNLGTMIDGAGYRTTYVYSNNRVKIRETIEGRNVYNITLLDSGRNAVYGDLISASYDPLGNATTYFYATSSNRLVSILDADGNFTHLRYGTGDQEWQLRSTTDPLGRRTTFTYKSDPNDDLVSSVTDPRGLVTSYSHSQFGDITAVQAPDGSVVTHTYDSLSRRIATTDPLGRRTSFTFDAADNMTSVQDPTGAVTTYVYEACLLTAIIDPLGAITTYAYDRFKNRVSTTDPNGNVTTNLYDNFGWLVAAQDPLGNLSTIVYNAARQKLADINPLGFATSFSYDPTGRIASIQDANGNFTGMIYNARDLIAQVDALQGRTSLGFDKLGRRISSQTPLGFVTTTAFDAAGQVTSQMDPLGFLTSYVYDPNGNLVSTQDALGQVTTNLYESNSNRLRVVQDATGAATSFTYDLAGQQIAVQDARGYVTTTSYDLAGRAVTFLDALGNMSTSVYDASGRQIASIDPLGRHTTSGYDPAGRLLSVTDSLGFVSSFLYDAANRQIASIDPSTSRWTTVYDAAGQTLVSVDPLGFRTTNSYDPIGNLRAILNARGYRTTLSYDPLNRLVVQQDALGYSTTYVFDGDSRQSAIIDPRGGIITMTYSARAEMFSISDQLGNKTTYSFDPIGQTSTRQFANGDVTSYTYDRAGRPTGMNYMDGGKTTFIYDPVGNRTTMQDATGSTSYAFDPLGRMVGKTDPGGIAQSYVYDAAGQRIRLVDPDGGIRSFTYDLGGRLEVNLSPEGIRTTLQYDPAGRETTQIDSTGLTRKTSYDPAGQIVSIIDLDSVGSSLDRFTFSYDEVGNRKTVEDLAGNLTTYTYDAKDRLTADLTSGPNAHAYTYSYDSTDNRLTSSETGTMASFSYDLASRLTTSIEGTALSTYTYEPNGNLSGVQSPSGRVTMSYDKENRLVRHEQPTAFHVATYTYDGDGLKRREIVGDETTILVWDGTDYLQGRSFLPTDIADLGAWFDASNQSSLFQDTSLTSPVTTDSQSVAGWKDLSGNGRNATQGTSTRRPLYKVSQQNGLPGILFDGGDCFDIANAAQLDEVTLFFVGRVNVGGGGVFSPHIVGAASGGFQAYLPQSGGSALKLILAEVTNLVVSTKAQADNTTVLWTGQFSNSSNTALTNLNGSAAGSKTPANTLNQTTSVLGAGNSTGGSGWGGYFFECIIYHRKLSATEIARVENYLNKKWAVVFSPLDIPDLGGWYDSASISTLFQDTSFSTPVTSDAQSVAGWLDKSGNERHLTQGTSTRQPKYKVNRQSGYPGLLFDGGDCFDMAGATQLDEVTFFFVGKVNMTSAVNPHIVGGASGCFQGYLPHTGSNLLKLIIAEVTNLQVATNAQSDNTTALWTAQFSDASDSALINLNGAADGTSTRTNHLSQVTSVVGAGNSSGGSGWKDDFYELLLYHRKLTSTEISQVEAYLNSKWGVY